jgi:uncharacterized Zn finger protein (UPF0148 family)
MGGFDEEAERERLREKYDQDREKREATQRMSELLLKGATMTNQHCEACGDPIFSHEGEEFCPTCDAPGADAEAGASETDAGETVSGEAAGAGAGADAATETDVPARTAPASSDADGRRGETAGVHPEPGPPPSSEWRDAPLGGEGRTRDTTPAREAPPATRETGGDDRHGPGESPVAQARASLERTLLRYARAAEEADDPRRATEALAAAREAAETLAALQ